MAEFDLVIHDGLVVDGSGEAPYSADVGVVEGRITSIGKIASHGRQDIDAEGLVVSPGFIDGHTHMDAQMFWDRLGRSSCYHGITSVVMGNCGFTLAPSRASERALVIRNLVRAEEIPAESMALGIPWGWESFREYLDALDQLPKAINYAAQIGHSALRTWAMGERAFDEQANEDDLAKMRGELRDALSAGAIGFSTARSAHETSDGRPVASRVASWEEVCELVEVLSSFGSGVFQIAPHGSSFFSEDPEVRSALRGELRSLAIESGVPMLMGADAAAEPANAEMLDYLASVRADGGKIIGMTNSRGLSTVFSFKAQLPFDKGEGWAKVRKLPLSEQARLYRDPDVRKALIEDGHVVGIGAIRDPVTRAITRIDKYDKLLYLDHALPPYRTLEELATSRGLDPIETLIDLGLETNFNAMFMMFHRDFRDELILKSIRDPNCVMTFSDNGAHVAHICDCSIHTYLLGHWMRQRQEFSLEEAVRMLTSLPATIWDLPDRGLVREGLIADLNVFDPATIAPAVPTVEHDFPGGAGHLQQKADGIAATIVAGEVVLRNGEPTGALPGQLIRGRLAHV